MKEDEILGMFFQPERWQYAIAKGIDRKDIRKDVMYQLTKPEVRAEVYRRIRDGKYSIMPPHTAQIPKDNGDSSSRTPASLFIQNLTSGDKLAYLSDE